KRAGRSVRGRPVRDDQGRLGRRLRAAKTMSLNNACRRLTSAAVIALVVGRASTAQPPDEQSVESLLAAARAAMAAGRLADAEPYLTRAVSAAPDAIEANLLLGQVYAGTGRPERAVERFQQVTRLDPALPHAHYFLGIAYTLTGKREEGIEELKRAAKLAPGNPGFGFYLGLAYLEARQDVEAGVNLAWAQINVGKSSDAAKSLTAVVAQLPTHAVAWFLLGEAMRRQGD